MFSCVLESNKNIQVKVVNHVELDNIKTDAFRMNHPVVV